MNIKHQENNQNQKSRTSIIILGTGIIVLLLLGGGVSAFYFFGTDQPNEKALLMNSFENLESADYFSFDGEITFEANESSTADIPANSSAMISFNGRTNFRDDVLQQGETSLAFSGSVNGQAVSFAADTRYINDTVYVRFTDFPVAYARMMNIPINQWIRYTDETGTNQPTIDDFLTEEQRAQISAILYKNRDMFVLNTIPGAANEERYDVSFDRDSLASFLRDLDGFYRQNLQNDVNQFSFVQLLAPTDALNESELSEDELSTIVNRLNELTIEFALDADTNVPREVLIETNTDQGKLTVNVRFSDFGEEVRVNAPENAIDYDTVMQDSQLSFPSVDAQMQQDL